MIYEIRQAKMSEIPFVESDIQSWIQDNLEQLTAERLAFSDANIQMMNRCLPEISAKLWNIGCWIESKLQELNFEKQKIKDVQVAYGQRCFGASDMYAPALAYVNEAYETNDVKDEPGPVLANKLIDEMFGI